ncbi:hypothetical protein BGAL_0243g00050 [Botrytis galanthina]|uniref:Uncharacterized protein n=1 Tax=Botrytis galanthina TaxID=278940 RepID=A0A4S8QY14_9HELO|nr:hypothetical protein BGAL_0243g00050 [Botrytis galanthina]
MHDTYLVWKKPRSINGGDTEISICEKKRNVPNTFGGLSFRRISSNGKCLIQGRNVALGDLRNSGRVKLSWKKEGSSRDTTLCSKAPEDGRDRSDKEVNTKKRKKNSGDHGAVYPKFLADISDFSSRYCGMRGIKAGTKDVLAVLASLGTLIEKELLNCTSVGNMGLGRVCLWAVVMIVNDIW